MAAASCLVCCCGILVIIDIVTCLSLTAYILPNPVQLLIHLRDHNFSLLCVCCVVMSYIQLCGLCVITNTERDVNINCYNVIKMWGKKEYVSHYLYLYNMFHYCQLASCVFHVFSFSCFYLLSFVQESFSQENCSLLIDDNLC